MYTTLAVGRDSGYGTPFDFVQVCEGVVYDARPPCRTFPFVATECLRQLQNACMTRTELDFVETHVHHRVETLCREDDSDDRALVDVYGFSLLSACGPAYAKFLCSSALRSPTLYSLSCPLSDATLHRAAHDGFASAQRRHFWTTLLDIDASTVTHVPPVVTCDWDALWIIDCVRTLSGFVRARPAETVKLFRVLSLYHKQHGYVQGINILAAFCFIFVSCEHLVFRMVLRLTDTLLPHYYGARSLEAKTADGRVLRHYVRTQDFSWANDAEVADMCTHIASTWYAKLFVNVLPHTTCARVWDRLLLFGPQVLCDTALRILSLSTQHTSCWEHMANAEERAAEMFDADAFFAIPLVAPPAFTAVFQKRYEHEHRVASRIRATALP